MFVLVIAIAHRYMMNAKAMLEIILKKKLPEGTMGMMMARSRWEIDLMINYYFRRINVFFFGIFILC